MNAERRVRKVRPLTFGAGCAKATTLREVVALIDCFLGAGSLVKSALTNTATRIRGRGATHSV